MRAKIQHWIPVIIVILVWTTKLTALQLNVNEIFEVIAKTKKTLLQENIQNGLNEKDILFLTIWNFDNTILHGDTSEGLVDNEGKLIFKGLAQVAIEAGLSKKYPANGGFARFWKDYKAMEKKDEPKAYGFLAQILAGAKQNDVLNLSTSYFDTTLKQHFFQAAKDLIVSLQNHNIQTRVITASPQLFVQGASPFLNIPRGQIYGIKTVVKDGIITDQLALPVTTRQGKVEKIQEIIKEILAENSLIKKVYVLAGFGNNNPNDIVFLKWIANQQFSTGKPLSVVGFQSPFLPDNFVTLLLAEEVTKSQKAL